MKIRIFTEIHPMICKQMIEDAQAKDRKDAEVVMKVLEGKAGELGVFRRKAAGTVLAKMMTLMGPTKLELVKDEFRARAKEGTEKFVSCANGVLIIEVPDEVINGARARGRENAGFKELRKRFKAEAVEYVLEK